MERNMDQILIDADYVKAKMESAGRTMMMLQVPGCWPAGYRSCNPEIVRSFADMIGVADDGEMPRVRASLAQIEEFEEVMRWVWALSAYCQKKGCIYVARSVCYALPRRVVDGRRKNSWRAIGRRFDGVHHETVKTWYEGGISIIVRQLNEKNISAQSGAGKHFCKLSGKL